MNKFLIGKILERKGLYNDLINIIFGYAFDVKSNYEFKMNYLYEFECINQLNFNVIFYYCFHCDKITIHPTSHRHLNSANHIHHVFGDYLKDVLPEEPWYDLKEMKIILLTRLNNTPNYIHRFGLQSRIISFTRIHL